MQNIQDPEYEYFGINSDPQPKTEGQTYTLEERESKEERTSAKIGNGKLKAMFIPVYKCAPGDPVQKLTGVVNSRAFKTAPRMFIAQIYS